MVSPATRKALLALDKACAVHTTNGRRQILCLLYIIIFVWRLEEVCFRMWVGNDFVVVHSAQSDQEGIPGSLLSQRGLRCVNT